MIDEDFGDYDDDYDSPEPVTVDCIIERETEKALLIVQDGKAIWIPRSVCDHISKRRHPTSNVLKLARIVMPEWLAEKKNLNYT